MRINKTQAVKEWLEGGNTITSFEAFEKWKATRLAVIIHSLRKAYGMNIVSQEMTTEDGTRYARYILREDRNER